MEEKDRLDRNKIRLSSIDKELKARSHSKKRFRGELVGEGNDFSGLPKSVDQDQGP